MNKMDYEKLEKALMRLREKYSDYQEMHERPELRESDKDSIKESLVKRFEICYGTLWKHLKKHMEQVENLPSVPNSPPRIFRTAHESAFIDAGMQERLIQYNELRSHSAHDCNMEKADRLLEKTGDFIQDASDIYQAMTAGE